MSARGVLNRITTPLMINSFLDYGGILRLEEVTDGASCSSTEVVTEGLNNCMQLFVEGCDEPLFIGE